jgi:hypothetical protein
LIQVYHEELVSRGVIQEVGLKQVQFTQLGTCPARMKIVQGKSILMEWVYETVSDNLFDVLNLLIFTL